MYLELGMGTAIASGMNDGIYRHANEKPGHYSQSIDDWLAYELKARKQRNHPCRGTEQNEYDVVMIEPHIMVQA